jgi:hypothetical protein
MANSPSTFLTLAILVGSIATVIAVVVGVHRALKTAQWPQHDRNRATGVIAALMTTWLLASIAAARADFFRGKSVPTIQYGIFIPVVVGMILFRSWPLLRRAMQALPQKWLVGIQFFRVEGAIFLVLLAAGKLPGIFAWPAGVGDILVGLFAPLVASAYMRAPEATAGTLRIWNLLGLLDLAVALTTGFLSSPSPLQVFAFDRPNVLIGAFPLVMIPVFLVPLAILLHFASLQKLRHTRQQRVAAFPDSTPSIDPQDQVA